LLRARFRVTVIASSLSAAVSRLTLEQRITRMKSNMPAARGIVRFVSPVPRFPILDQIPRTSRFALAADAADNQARSIASRDTLSLKAPQGWLRAGGFTTVADVAGEDARYLMTRRAARSARVVISVAPSPCWFARLKSWRKLHTGAARTFGRVANHPRG